MKLCSLENEETVHESSSEYENVTENDRNNRKKKNSRNRMNKEIIRIVEKEGI